MTTTTTTTYDDVPYDTEANADAHPSAIATLARLVGLDPCAPSRARVLEIGCGNGENILAAATYLPGARFVGFDLAASSIAAGNAAAKASSNVTLFASDIREVRRGERSSEVEPRSFDYVIAHGMYSWVPDPIREDLLAVMHDALAPRGLGFLSINALPGWELRRALRELACDATRGIDDPGAKVSEALRLIAEIGRAGKGLVTHKARAPEGRAGENETQTHAFFGALSAAAREYLEHVERATLPTFEAPFSRYVFHDLLAECNEAFSIEQLAERLARAGLRIVCEAPLRPSRAGPSFESLAADMASTGAPFLQVIVQRADEATSSSSPPSTNIDPSRALDLELWADLTSVPPSQAYRTTTNAIVRPSGDDGIARAIRHAPGFVRVRDLADDDDEARTRVARQLFERFCEGVFTLCAERPLLTSIRGAVGEKPRVADHVRARAAAACEKRKPSAVLTNALHRSFRVPWAELVIVRSLDGKHGIAEIARRACEEAAIAPPSLSGPFNGATERDAERFVEAVVDRHARHLFFLQEGSEST